MKIWADSQKRKGRDKMCSQHVDRQMSLTARTSVSHSHPLLSRGELFCPFVELQAIWIEGQLHAKHRNTNRHSSLDIYAPFFSWLTLSLAYTNTHLHTGDILSQHSQAGVELLTGLQNGTMGILGPLR